MPLLPSLLTTVTSIQNTFPLLPDARKKIIRELTEFVSKKMDANQEINLNFICTHNSRRSHIAQLWAQAGAYYYGIGNVHSFSGGTETTAFNPRAVKAMTDAGFDIAVMKEGTNPVYRARYSEDNPAVEVFSKKYDDAANPSHDFAAVMTCSHADENCPLVIGATKRIALTYNDPKDFDGTTQEEEKYAERVREIGREILFAFSQAKAETR